MTCHPWAGCETCNEARLQVVRRRAIRARWVFGALLLLSFIWAASLRAQAPAASPKNPPLLVFVDTAGVAPIADDVFVVWTFAKATPSSWPSSGVLVAFDCGRKMVRRLAHVVYRLRPDSLGVEGDILEDQLPWQTISIPKMFDLVCAVGRQHVAEGMHPVEEPHYPEARKAPQPPVVQSQL